MGTQGMDQRGGKTPVQGSSAGLEQRSPSAEAPSTRRELAGSSETSSAGDRDGRVVPPTISLPRGGGAIRGMGEKFTTNPVTGTASLSVPIFTSPGRGGFGPELALSYDSGSGNG